MENPFKMDDLGVPLFLGNIHLLGYFTLFWGDFSTNLHGLIVVIKTKL